MNGFEVSDYTLLYKLRTKLDSLIAGNYKEYSILSKMRNCTTRANVSGVHILKSGNKVKFSGVLHCHKYSVCPVCAAFKHAQLKKLLSAAFKMQKQKNLVAFMTTFTIVSVKEVVKVASVDTIIDITAKEMIDLLLLTQKKFNQNKFFQKLKADLKISDSFFATETTYNLNNGWHPHNHSLYWLPAENLDALNDLEPKMQAKWRLAQKSAIEEYFKCDEDSNSDEDFVKRLKRNILLNVLEHSKALGLFISKDKQGKVREATDSNYFWASVEEVSGIKFKEARSEKSRTIFQLLQDALLKDDNFAWYKYLEFAIASHRRQIFRFSQGFLKETKEFIKNNPEIFEQKKSTKPEKYQQVCWFSQESWRFNNFYCKKFQTFITSFCQVENTFDLIIELCEALNLQKPLKEGPFTLKIAA